MRETGVFPKKATRYPPHIIHSICHQSVRQPVSQSINQSFLFLENSHTIFARAHSRFSLIFRIGRNGNGKLYTNWPQQRAASSSSSRLCNLPPLPATCCMLHATCYSLQRCSNRLQRILIISNRENWHNSRKSL